MKPKKLMYPLLLLSNDQIKTGQDVRYYICVCNLNTLYVYTCICMSSSYYGQCFSMGFTFVRK